jgi:hypothetical protein
MKIKTLVFEDGPSVVRGLSARDNTEPHSALSALQHHVAVN